MTRALGPNGALVAGFLARLALLTPAEYTEVVRTWRDTLRETNSWYGAEDAVGDAIALTRRQDEQWRLQEQIYELFRASPWYSAASPPHPMVPATEAAAQYLASTAAFALLVADEIGARDFSVLYGPFALVIPLASLGPSARHSGQRETWTERLVDPRTGPERTDA